MGKKREKRRARIKALDGLRRQERCAFEEFKWAEYSGYVEGDEFMTKRYSSGKLFLVESGIFIFRILALSCAVLFLGCMIPLISGEVENVSGCATLALKYSALGVGCYLMSGYFRRKYFR